MSEKLRYHQLSEHLFSEHKNSIAHILASALGQPEKVHRVLGFYQSQNQAWLWGCFYQQKLIAVACFCPLHSEHDREMGALELKHFAVATQYRQQGLGRACLLGLIETLQLYRLDLQCDAESVGFYRQLGFATRAESPEVKNCLRRYGAYYLDRSHVLKNTFRFPEVALEKIRLPELEQNIHILRLDLLHPLLSGNKWFKLWPSLLKASASGKNKILSFGGAYSNHLYALAAAGKLLGFETQAVIRGECPETLNAQLQFCESMGMHLQFVTRQQYRALREAAEYADFCQKHPEYICIPEGGGHEDGLQGAALIQEYIHWQGKHTLAMACGTGASLAGLILQRPALQKIVGVSVLKGDFHQQMIRDWLKQTQDLPVLSWEIETRFHCGGYAKKNPALEAFISAFEACNAVPIEHVYTAKLLFALQEKLKLSELSGPILAVHSGGVYPKI